MQETIIGITKEYMTALFYETFGEVYCHKKEDFINRFFDYMTTLNDDDYFEGFRDDVLPSRCNWDNIYCAIYRATLDGFKLGTKFQKKIDRRIK